MRQCETTTDMYQYNWQLCDDLKAVALLLGLQGEFTKYSDFLCEWESRDRSSHSIRTNWPLQQSREPGRQMFSNHHELS